MRQSGSSADPLILGQRATPLQDLVKELAGHPFFANCGFTNARYLFDHVSAQVTLIELSGGPCHVKNAETTVPNGQVACMACNAAKGNSVGP